MFGLGDFDIKKTRFYEEVREEILEEVRQEKALELIMRQLRRRIGNMDQQLQERISQLAIEQLENLALSLLDFSSQADLATWLQDKSNQV